MTRAVIGLATLFSAAAMATGPGSAEGAAYNPDPANAAEARQQITYLRDQLAALPARFAGAANALAAAAPVPLDGKQPGRKTCYALSTASISLSFDYGPGRLRSPLARVVEVPAHDDATTGRSVPDAGNFTPYPDLPAFLRAYQTSLGTVAYTNVLILPSLIGCAASADDLRPMQMQTNLAFYLALRGRVSARIEQDYDHARAVLYRETQDPILTGPTSAQP
jgi:hypothetical protein